MGVVQPWGVTGEERVGTRREKGKVLMNYPPNLMNRTLNFSTISVFSSFPCFSLPFPFFPPMAAQHPIHDAVRAENVEEVCVDVWGWDTACADGEMLMGR